MTVYQRHRAVQHAQCDTVIMAAGWCYIPSSRAVSLCLGCFRSASQQATSADTHAYKHVVNSDPQISRRNLYSPTNEQGKLSQWRGHTDNTIILIYTMEYFTLLCRWYCDDHVYLCLCVCLCVCTRAYIRNHMSSLHQIFCTSCPWPWLGLTLAALKSVMCFRFHVWRHVFK